MLQAAIDQSTKTVESETANPATIENSVPGPSDGNIGLFLESDAIEECFRDSDDEVETNVKWVKAHFGALPDTEKEKHYTDVAEQLCRFFSLAPRPFRQRAFEIFTAPNFSVFCAALLTRLKEYSQQPFFGARRWPTAAAIRAKYPDFSQKDARVTYAEYRTSIRNAFRTEMQEAPKHKVFVAYSLLNVLSQIRNLYFGNEVTIQSRTASQFPFSIAEQNKRQVANTLGLHVALMIAFANNNMLGVSL